MIANIQNPYRFVSGAGGDFLLNFSKTLGEDHMNIDIPFDYNGVFTFDIDFEYSALDSSFAGLAGNNPPFRILVRAANMLITVADNANMTYSEATSLNIKYNISVRRDGSNDVYASLDGITETLLGTKSGLVQFNRLAKGFSRFLTGKIYRFNINGEEFACNEGSGSTVTGDSGTVYNILTINAGGQTYIDNTMWEAI